MEQISDKDGEIDNLHKKVNSFESDVKKLSGLETEFIQVKNREKDLQRIIDEAKYENETLRNKIAAGSSNEGSGKSSLLKQRFLVTRLRTLRSNYLMPMLRLIDFR